MSFPNLQCFFNYGAISPIVKGKYVITMIMGFRKQTGHLFTIWILCELAFIKSLSKLERDLLLDQFLQSWLPYLFRRSKEIVIPEIYMRTLGIIKPFKFRTLLNSIFQLVYAKRTMPITLAC